MAFFNPYSFVPAPARGPGGGALPDGLRDGAPPGHDRWHEHLWSGRIEVTMRVVTPLLVMRTDGEDPPGHRRLRVATLDGRVDLAPTQLKGMLRAAFEAATGSRFGVFDQYRRLGYRAAAEPTALRPAIVTGARRVEIPGLLRIEGEARSRPPEAPVTAWAEHNGGRTWLLAAGLAHGARADAVIEPVGAPVGWATVSLHPQGQAPVPGPGQYTVRGLLHATGPTIKAKRSERLIITGVLGAGPDTPALTQTGAQVIDGDRAERLVDELRELVAGQRAVHRSANANAVTDRGHPPWAYLGHEPGRTAWSRHLYDVTDPAAAPGWLGPDVVLPPPPGHPVTCWAETERGNRLRPVKISRLRYDRAPSDLLDPSLHPAATLDALSPADRVFGWTRPGSGRPDGAVQAAHRGQLRITELRCPQAEDAVEQIAELTLEPLSSPKPSQARFYLGAKDRNGAPLGADVRRSGFFDAETQSLRGRKFYPHHRELEGLTTEEFRQARRYDPPVDENGRVRPERDTQNVTIHEWVRPGTEFRFTVRVQNLHPLELGALLWLLDPQRCGNRQPARHRLGMGRPLGFGAVELTATRVEVQDGAGMRRFLDTLGAAPMSAEDPPDFAATFAESMTGEFAGALATLRLVLSGFPPRVDREPAPVRYPRNGRGPIYQWFVKNEEDAAAGAAQVLRRRGDRDHLDRNDERRP